MLDKDFSVFERSERVVMPTSLVGVASDGRCFGEDGSVWAYFSVPLSPMLDAKSGEKFLDSAAPLFWALDGLCALGGSRGLARRRLQKSSYRQYRLLVVSLDALFDPPWDTPLRDTLLDFFPSDVVTRRVVLLGVKLEAKSRFEGFRAALENVAATFSSGRAPLEDFDEDFFKVKALFARCGFTLASNSELKIARAWWNQGRNADLPYMCEDTCFHVFSTMGVAEKCREDYAKKIPREKWVKDGRFTYSFAAVTNFDMPMVDVKMPGATWVSDLIDQGAACISISGLLEPGRITAKEIDRQSNAYEGDIRDGEKQGRGPSPEQMQKLETLAEIRSLYQGSTPQAVSIDTSVVVAFNGDNIEFRNPYIELSLLNSRQSAAMGETWLTPNVKANPSLHDLPLATICFSGITSLSKVGDKSKNAALIGYTERDRQPAWFNPAAVMKEADSPPLGAVMGMSGSGKTMLLLWLLVQSSMLNHKTVYIDPKEESDFTKLFKFFGGKVYSLSDIIGADGILDPIRIAPDAKNGISLAASMLSFINPWGDNLTNMELALNSSLAYGVSRGARSILSALNLARKENYQYATNALIDPITAVAASIPSAAALIGSTDDGPRLSFDTTLSMIRVGSMSLDLPEAGNINLDLPLSQRIAVALIRQLVRGSTIAVRGDYGVVGLDEAWLFFDSAGSELVSLGRLARSQKVTILMGTQRVRDIEQADLKDFISFGWILGMSSDIEAAAACRLINLEPSGERINRILAPRTITNENGQEIANWNSMRALKDPYSGKTLRGSIAITYDLNDRAIYTEIRLPEKFLNLIPQ